MDEAMDESKSAIERLGAAAESLERVLGKIEAQYESLNAKVDRIVAAIEDGALEASAEPQIAEELQEKVAQLERQKTELEAQARRLGRKTLSPLVCGLLAKSGVESQGGVEEAALDKALGALSVEQRIAVKAEMARAGLL
jgi:predicted RNase H-like nuclease (RuvC/YqgF family)